MLSSMTGFGRAVHHTSFGRLTIEIQSVNRKLFEAFVSIPKEFARFELEVRKWISDVVTRGQISVRIFFVPNVQAIEDFLPDVEVLQGVKNGWDKIAAKLGIDSKTIDLNFIMQYLPVATKQDF